MAKKAKIKAATIAKAMNLTDVSDVIVVFGSGEDSVEISIKPRLSVTERAMMVNDIVNMTFIVDDNHTRYCPAFKKFAIEYNIVTYFTDVTLPSDSDKACKFIEESNIVYEIVSALSDGYVAAIIADATEAIEYRKQELLKKSKIDELFDSIREVVQALGVKTDGIDLPQIMEYVDKNIPEFKGQIEQLISAQTADATVSA